MNKEQLLEELHHHTWCMLQASPIHGIGVFALRDIPKGCTNLFSTGIGNWLPIPFAEVEALPAHSRQLIETYCLYDDDCYFVPDYGFKLMDLVLYLNHCDTPNIASVNDGEYFITLRDIADGEELFVDYGSIVDTDE
jgi:SET domain-containing protein